MRTHGFTSKRHAKLGTEKNPVVVHVQTEDRRREISAIFEKHDWKYLIEMDPDTPEDISSLERLLNPPSPTTAEKKIGRNAPCPCGSGNKFKRCCGQ
ncbi:MAG: zinc chelation protein SecC [Desulfobacca sp.]|nr:zinc chelation protein SecC [Desulfobacca sp.]